MKYRLSKITYLVFALSAGFSLPAYAANSTAIKAVEAAARAQAARASAMQKAAAAQESARVASAARAETVQKNTNRIRYAKAKIASQRAPTVGRVANDVNRLRANGQMSTYGPKGMQIQRSNHQGKLGELVKERSIYARGNLAVPQVTMRTKAGNARTDFIEFNPTKRSFVFDEAKTGSAALSRNQAAAYPAMRSTGGAISFRGSDGTHLIGPTPVNVSRL